MAIGLLGLTLTASGCVSTYQHTDVKTTGTPLNPEKAVAISVPKNGHYGKTIYRHSGEMTAAAIKAAFSRHISNVEITKEAQTVESLRDKAPGRYGYYVKPSILQWEDRATEWSGIPDRIEIQVQIYDVDSGLEIRNSIYTGKSKWFTFGGDHPQDLLPKPTRQFVDSLYKK